MFRRMTRERYLSDAELARFMAAVRERRHVHQIRDHAFFALLANTGIRPSEALALTAEHLHLEEAIPWIRITRLKKKKATREIDDLPVSPTLAEILAARAREVDPGSRLFPTTRRTAARAFHYYAWRAGFRGCNLYSLRHTAATRLYDATRDIKLVQAVLGHEQPDMSCIYAHVQPSQLVAAMASFPVFV